MEPVMTDLVKRLRDWEHVHPEDYNKDAGHLYEEAADFIERQENELNEACVIMDQLEAEVERLWEAVAGAIYLLDPEPEDILRGAGIYRIVLAYHLSGGVLSDDLMTLLEEMKEKSDGHKPDGKTYGDQPLADRSAPARGLVRWR
jgi:hypothetical protein